MNDWQNAGKISGSRGEVKTKLNAAKVETEATKSIAERDVDALHLISKAKLKHEK